MNKQKSETKRTTVSLEASVYHRLRSRGEFGQTFSEVVRRILDQVDAINGDLVGRSVRNAGTTKGEIHQDD